MNGKKEKGYIPPEEVVKEKIGKFEDTKVPFLEEQKKKLEDFIANSRELQARIESLKNPLLPDENFFQMISSWNEEHKEWVGGYVEKEITDTKGRVLKIRMDRNGNVQLAGHC